MFAQAYTKFKKDTWEFYDLTKEKTAQKELDENYLSTFRELIYARTIFFFFLRIFF